MQLLAGMGAHAVRVGAGTTAPQPASSPAPKSQDCLPACLCLQVPSSCGDTITSSSSSGALAGAARSVASSDGATPEGSAARAAAAAALAEQLHMAAGGPTPSNTPASSRSHSQTPSGTGTPLMQAPALVASSDAPGGSGDATPAGAASALTAQLGNAAAVAAAAAATTNGTGEAEAEEDTEAGQVAAGDGSSQALGVPLAALRPGLEVGCCLASRALAPRCPASVAEPSSMCCGSLVTAQRQSPLS